MSDCKKHSTYLSFISCSCLYVPHKEPFQGLILKSLLVFVLCLLNMKDLIMYPYPVPCYSLQAMFEGILVDIPFATFFLSKLKQK